MTSLMRASGRSTLFTTRITGSFASSAFRSTKRVCGSGPSLASTSSSTPSTIVRPRSTSPPKSACPGVSTMLIFTAPYRTAVFLARIVIPFSRSRSVESSTRSATSWFSRNDPDCQSIASTSVVFPWSTCATIATLRRSFRSLGAVRDTAEQGSRRDLCARGARAGIVFGMTVRLLALALVTAALAGCGSSGDGSTTAAESTSTAATTTAAQAAPIPRLGFGYAAAAPLRYVDSGRVNTRSYPIASHDISYVSDGKRVQAFLLVPPGSGRRPAVVFVHGAGGDRGSMLVQAAWLAARNVVTMVITEPSSGTPPKVSSSLARRLRQVRDVQVHDEVAVRRAVDVLKTLPQVDDQRIGYVGLSAGAKTGVLVAASEPRMKALVLLSAGAAPLSDFVARAPAKLKADARLLLGSVDPIRYAAKM